MNDVGYDAHGVGDLNPAHICARCSEPCDNEDDLYCRNCEAELNIFRQPANGKTVYLAGKITYDPQYREKFKIAERELTAAGFVVINPAKLPQGFTYAAYMRMTSAMLNECSTICLLPDWRSSSGAKHEFHQARLCGKQILFFEERQMNGNSNTACCL